MTRNEALERARLIWGERVMWLPEQPSRADGMWEVALNDGSGIHFLDRNGHTACHNYCSKREEQFC